MAITHREYRRLIERLNACRPRGWADVWLVAAGAGLGLVAAALVTALSLANATPPATKTMIWMLVPIGGIVFLLSIGAYSAQRRSEGDKITELKKDMEIHTSPINTPAGGNPCLAALPYHRHRPIAKPSSQGKRNGRRN